VTVVPAALSFPVSLLDASGLAAPQSVFNPSSSPAAPAQNCDIATLRHCGVLPPCHPFEDVLREQDPSMRSCHLR
jgi:hypothetical protein